MRERMKSKRRGISPAPLFIRGDTASVSSLYLLERIHDLAGRYIRRREHSLVGHALPSLEASAVLDVVVLHLHHAGLGPLTVGAIAPVSHNGLVRGLAQPLGNLV